MRIPVLKSQHQLRGQSTVHCHPAAFPYQGYAFGKVISGFHEKLPQGSTSLHRQRRFGNFPVLEGQLGQSQL